MVEQSDTLVYFATATAFAPGLLVAMGFHEPPAADCGDQRQRLQSYRYAIKAALEHPVLNWLLAQSIVMSGARPLPFVFDQAFFLASLKTVGFETRVRL